MADEHIYTKNGIDQSHDIVTRLREQAQAPALAWLADAADEIERLRKKLDSFGTTCQALRDKIRLRALDELTAQAEELGLYDAPQRAWEEARRG